MITFLRDILITIILAVVIFFGLQATVQNYIILEHSMEPSLYEGQRVLVNKIVYKFHEPERRDIIILHPPSQYDSKATPFIKRVIGLPGETVEVKNNGVYINGVKLDEPYIKESPNYTLKRQLGENEYFVLGDNRNNSNDSHIGWTIPRQNIMGKAWLKIWPPDKWGLATSYLPQINQLKS